MLAEATGLHQGESNIDGVIAHTFDTADDIAEEYAGLRRALAFLQTMDMLGCEIDLHAVQGILQDDDIVHIPCIAGDEHIQRFFQNAVGRDHHFL